MAHYQEIVDRLVTILSSSKTVGAEEVEECANAYANLCYEANDRLRICDDSLRRGLRSDAIQVAETEPNLLDLVVALDFPELPQWREACTLTNFREAPPLLMEVAAALNEVYAAEQGVSNLLAHHRLMALARAPLTQRLRLMRRIADLDPTSSFWEDDIQVFERKRLEQITTQFHNAVRVSDSNTISQLRDEINAPGWRTQVPRNLLKSLDNAFAHLAAASGLAEACRLLPKLNDAYSGMAHQECKTLLAQILAIMAAARVTLPPDLQEQVDPIRDWVLEQDQLLEHQAAFREACESLQQAIDTNQPTPALEQAYQRTLSFHLELDEETESRYRQRLASRAVAIRHRRRLFYVGIGAAFIIISGIVTLVAYRSMLSHEIADAHQTLAQAISDIQQGDIDKGQNLRKLVVEQHPRVLHSLLIDQDLNDLDSAIDSENKRRADFKQHMAAALAAGVEKPDDAELQNANGLAKLPQETAQIDDLKSRINEFNAQMQQERDRQFAADGAALGTLVDQTLTPQLMSSPDDFTKQIDVLTNKEEGLRNRNGISGGLRDAQLASLDALLKHRQQDFQAQQDQRNAWHQLQNFGSTAEEHAAALKQYIATCPDDPRCATFNLALGRLDAERAVENWSDVVGKMSPKILPVSLAAATQQLAEIKDYNSQNPSSPLAGPLQDYLAYLNKGIEAVSTDGPWNTTYRSLLANPLVQDLRYLEATDGQRFYVMPDVKVKSDGSGDFLTQTFDAVTSPDVTSPTSITLKGDNPLKDIEPALSPQAAFAKIASRQLDALDCSNWDVFGINELRELTASKDMNPILQAIMLQHILQTNQATAAWSLPTGFDDVSKELAQQNVDDIQWLDPTHPPDANVLQDVKSTIAGLPSLEDARASIVQRRNAMVKAIAINIAGEGILLRSGHSYEIDSSTAPADGQIAVVLTGDKGLIQIGSYSNSRWAIDPTTAGSVPEGTLVFVLGSPISGVANQP
ncbi:MAG TPA: hypothetical protein VHX86_10550 [Tepidisphaeraceae bacterium]|jgi:hypothetical protein|nr:hypothetical protein [Tepidisphaeraceae bacterium]